MSGLTYSQLIVGGSTLEATFESRLQMGRLRIDYDSPGELEFAIGPGVGPIPSLALGTVVELKFDRENTAQTVFRGKIVSCHPSKPASYIWGYRVIGQANDLNFIPILNPDGSNHYNFNQPSTSEEYAPSLAGKTIGQIIKKVLEDHTSALSDANVGITNVAEFLALDHTPLDPVTVGPEESLWNWLTGFVSRYAPNHRPYLDFSPTTTQIRLADLAAPSSTVAVVVGGSARLVEPPLISTSIEGCASRVRIVGGEEIEPYSLTRASGMLLRDWTESEELAWNYGKFQVVTKAVSTGSVSSMTESAVVVDPSDNTRSWAANYWAGERLGKLRLIQTPISGYTLQQTREVSSNTSLNAGGTSTINVTTPFTLNTFTSYELYGLAGDGEWVWRRYTPADPDLRAKLRRLFPKDVVYNFAAGAAAIGGIRVPMGFIVKDGIRYQQIIEIDQGNGRIWFNEPVVSHPSLGNTKEDLDSGNVIAEPDDEVAFLPVSVGRLETYWPSSHGGKAFEWYGLQRIKTVFLPKWEDKAALAQIQTLAKVIHDSCKDPVMSGSLIIHGFNAHEFLPLNKGVTLSATVGPTGPTIDLGRVVETTFPVRGVSVEWGDSDGMRITLSLSTDRRPGSSPDIYQHGISGQAINNNFVPFSQFGEQGASFGGVDWLSPRPQLLASIPDFLANQPKTPENMLGSIPKFLEDMGL